MKKDAVILGNYAKFLVKCKEFDRAKIYYLHSIFADTTRSWPVERYAGLLSDLGDSKEAEYFYSIWRNFIVLYQKNYGLRRSWSYMKPNTKKMEKKQN